VAACEIRGELHYPFAVMAVIVSASALAVYWLFPDGQRTRILIGGTFGFIAGAALVYVLLGISPYVQWRA